MTPLTKQNLMKLLIHIKLKKFILRYLETFKQENSSTLQLLFLDQEI